MQILIHFNLYFSWIQIQKRKLSNHILTANDVSTNVNLNKILKFALVYCELSCIRMFLDYLDWLRKDVFFNDHIIWTSNIFHDIHYRCKQLACIYKNNKGFAYWIILIKIKRSILILHQTMKILLETSLLHVYDIMNIWWTIFANYLKT
jgi:hypothetical protein